MRFLPPPPIFDLGSCVVGSLLPHPDFCDGFLFCTGSALVQMCCPSGLVWDDVKQVCNWPVGKQCSSDCHRVPDRPNDQLLCCPFVFDLLDVSGKYLRNRDVRLHPDGGAIFNGASSYLAVPAFVNSFNGGHGTRLTVRLWVQVHPGGQARQGLLVKGNCEEDPAFEVSLIKNSSNNSIWFVASMNGHEVRTTEMEIQQVRVYHYM